MSHKFDSIRSRLVKPETQRNAAAQLGYDIWRSFCLFGCDERERSQLCAAYLSFLARNSQQHILSEQIAYARTLAESKGDLLYEEMHKLFSLCDQIEALRQLGVNCDNAAYSHMVDQLRKRFRDDPIKVRLVAEDKVEDWKKSWWWYRESLCT